MKDNPVNQAASEVPSPPTPLEALHDLEQAVERQLEPFLQRVKQRALEVIDEVGQKQGNPLVAQLRETLVETLAVLLRNELAARLDRLKPAWLEGTSTVRQNADSLLDDLKQLITQTAVALVRVHAPEYSRWAGQRLFDYVIASTLFCLAAVLLILGCVLGLEKIGMPPFATYILGGGVALAAGWTFLKVRSRKWRDPHIHEKRHQASL
jgi:hypothetical protein